MISSMIAVNAGSNCPSSGVDIARRTRGSAMLGPGPSRMRGGGSRSLDMRRTLAACVRLRQSCRMRVRWNLRPQRSSIQRIHGRPHWSDRRCRSCKLLSELLDLSVDLREQPRLIDAREAPVAYRHLTVHHHEIDVGAALSVDQLTHGVVQ